MSVTGLPHARGGVSGDWPKFPGLDLSSPCSWGCFRCAIRSPRATPVFPMLVGVFLGLVIGNRHPARLPHARGGVSVDACRVAICGASSPCSWGCFSGRKKMWRENVVFPMLVGVFLLVTGYDVARRGLPHARGGVSVLPCAVFAFCLSSPCSWGCFWQDRHVCCCRFVFPMLVGVFLSLATPVFDCSGLPHARGGVSLYMKGSGLS